VDVTIQTETIRQLLRGLFPDPAVEIGEAAVKLAIDAMRHDWRPEWEELFGVVKPDEHDHMDASGIVGERGARYYMAHATHTRMSPVQSSFTGHLPMVRVTMPVSGQEQIDTGGGTVFAGDTLLYNRVKLIEHLDEFDSVFGTDLGRCRYAEFVVPPRLWGARFGAIGLILLYEDATDPTPVGYALIPGMATGEARLIFVAPSFDQPIVRRAWYQPTPFSKGSNWYRGNLKMRDDRPDTLDVEVFETDANKEGAKPHLHIHVAFEEVPHGQLTFPGFLTVQAACRVCVIAQAMGTSVPGIPDVLRDVLAGIGKTLGDWHKEPA
jgi:hypothetical protein